MTTYRMPRRLTMPAWETVCGPRRGPLTAAGHWSRRVVAEGLCLDFARVEFVDFGALARALLLLDAAVRADIPATLVMPAEEVGAGEAARVARRARTRGDARAFMRHVGFQDALRAPHWPPGAVSVRDVGSIVDERPEGVFATDETGPIGADPYDEPYRLRRILPFQWLVPLEGEALRQSEAFVRAVQGLHDLGLSQSDARALSHAVLTELVENVARHAGSAGAEPPPALVGAILLDADTFVARRDDLPEQLGGLVDCVTATGSPVLRLAVGDSGVGLAARLVPGGRRPRTSQAAVLYAFDGWSTGRDDAEPQRGPRGLWRVARLVSGYRGSVVVRTANAQAGRVFGVAPTPAEIAAGGLGQAPGTLLEVSILTDPGARGLSAPWEARPVSAEGESVLRWIRCAFDSRYGLGDADLARLDEAVRTARDAGVVATIPAREGYRHLSHDALREALRRALDSANRTGGPAPVVVVLPDADPRILDVSVSGLHQDMDGSRAAAAPILVVGADGAPMWCGGSAPLRAVLDALGGASGVLSDHAAERCWLEAGGDPGGPWSALADQGRLVGRSAGHLVLRQSPRTVLATLADGAQRDLAQAVARGGPGVELGWFRTPTLRISDRWIDVDRLLSSAVGTDVAAFLLARKVEEVLAEPPNPVLRTVVAQAPTAPRSLSSQLSECLLFGGRDYPMPGELDLDGVSTTEGVPAGARVVLCADLLSTENSVRRAAAEIVSVDAEPAVVACVIDARAQRGPVRLLNRTIPVVSLAEVRLRGGPPEGDPPAPVVDIDPILRRPLHTASAPVPPTLADGELLLWCANDPGALRLGHITRPRRMHFSAYLQLERVQRNQETWRRVLDAVLETLRPLLRDVCGLDARVPGGGRALQIWYPGVPTDYAGTLAAAVCERLRAEAFQVGDVISVPRAVAGGQWVYPVTFRPGGPPQPVVIVDWAALSATTVQQMVRLAADAGATAIATVVMLNQLDAQDAKALGVLRAVSGRPDGAAVPAVVRFVSASSIAGLAAHECAICTTRARYDIQAEGLPERLRRHARRLREMLRPRNRGEVFRDAAADLFTVPISGEDVVDYLRWRGLLERALGTTMARHEVIDRLTALAKRQSGPTWTRRNLVRLLAAEQQWLRLPPLRFAETRELLAEVCVSGLRRSVARSPWLRAQALMVLSTTQPQRLVDLLPELLTLVLDETVVVDQMALECYRLLQRPEHDTPIDIASLRRSLMECRDLLEHGRAGRSPAVEDYLHVFQVLFRIADHYLRPRPRDAQAAWEQLREQLQRPVEHHRLESELLRVRGIIEDLAEVEPTPKRMADLRSEWRNSARELRRRALVNLPPLREILSGEYVESQIGRKDQERLLSLAPPNEVIALDAMTDLLHRLSREPWRPGDPDWQSLRRKALERVNWWYRMFLATHLPDGDGPALVVDLVRAAPVKLAEQVVESLELRRSGLDVEQVGEPVYTYVFCPGKLLDQTIAHLLENVTRHHVAGADCRLQIEYGYGYEGTVQFVLRNSGTRPRETSGNGLRTFNERLRPFGGSVVGQPLPDDPWWTYAATVTLRLWRGA